MHYHSAVDRELLCNKESLLMRETYTIEDVKRIEKFDFFSGSKESFKKQMQTDSAFRWGTLSEDVPLVTVLFPHISA